MKRYITYRLALLSAALLLGMVLSACGTKTANPAIEVSGIPANSGQLSSGVEAAAEASISPAPEKPAASATITDAPAGISEELTVRGVTFSLGDSIKSLAGKLGTPGRIDKTEYDFNYYIYNNDYSRLLLLAVRHDKIVGFYTDSLDFNYNGISSGSNIQTVNSALHKTFSMDNVLTAEAGQYTVNILMDKLETQKVTGIYVLESSAKPKAFDRDICRGVEQLVYDLTNSIRVRNSKALLSWSSAAAVSARKHSEDMAVNNYFDHIDLNDNKPSERLRSEGLYVSTCGENIIAGYGTAILSTHAWFNSTGHRKNMLHSDFRYLGVGFYYSKGSNYKNYITQDFYR